MIVGGENPLEIENLISKTDSIQILYKSNKGYAFEIFSRRDNLILIHAEDDRASLVEVGEKPEFQTDGIYFSLCKFEIYLELHLPTDIESLGIILNCGISLDFISSGAGFDCGQNTVTWDLSMLKFLVNELDIASLRQI